MRTDDALDLIARQRQYARDDMRRAPSERPGRLPCHAFVPRHLALERPEIVEPGLHLDDQERPGPSIERQQIDPSV